MKTSSLGDVVHHCPAVTDAARHAPDAEIDWVVEEAFSGVAAMHSCVRRVIPVAMRRWRNSLWRPSAWSEIAAFRRALAHDPYDVVIDSQGLLKSALICTAAAGPVHGMDRASAREPIAARFYDVAYSVARNLHAVERNRRLTAQVLEYALDGFPGYGLRANASLPVEVETPFAVFLTMTSRADKLWPETHWTGLGKALGMRVVLPWGNADERARAERIAAGIRNAIVPPRLALDALGSLLQGATTVVGLDTGLTHLAFALGTRTIGVYCGSDPALTGLYGSGKAVNVGSPGRMPSVADVLDAAK